MPRYIGPFEVLERVSTIAYWLALPLSLLGVHVAFHVSMLGKYTPDPTHGVDWGELVVDADGTFEEGPVCLMDSWDQVLQGKTVRLVKVLWQHRGVEEATWECEDIVRELGTLDYVQHSLMISWHEKENMCRVSARRDRSPLG